MSKPQQDDPYKTQIGKWIAAMRTAPNMAALNQIKDEWIDFIPESHPRRGELTGTYLCHWGFHYHGLFWPLVTTDQRLADAAAFHQAERERKARASQGKKGAA